MTLKFTFTYHHLHLSSLVFKWHFSCMCHQIRVVLLNQWFSLPFFFVWMIFNIISILFQTAEFLVQLTIFLIIWNFLSLLLYVKHSVSMYYHIIFMIASSYSPVVTVLIVSFVDLCRTVWLCVLVIKSFSFNLFVFIICQMNVFHQYCHAIGIFPSIIFSHVLCIKKTFVQSACLCHCIVFSSLLTYVGILVASNRSFLSHLHLWEKWYKKD